jgi:hypothetical protein
MSAIEKRAYSDCLSGSWLASREGVDPGVIDARRRAGELIAVRPEGSAEWLYPAWQFAEGAPRPAIARIVRVARSLGITDSRLYEILAMPMGLRRSSRLADLILEDRADEVVDAIRRAASS